MTFEQRVKYLKTQTKGYINYGPNTIDPKVHRSQCRLLLQVTDDEEMGAFRASIDPYAHDTNFADLPDFVMAHQSEKVTDTQLNSTNQFKKTMQEESQRQAQESRIDKSQKNLLRQTYVFDEKRQVAKFYQQESACSRKNDAFKGMLSHFNKKVSKKKYRTLPIHDLNQMNKKR